MKETVNDRIRKFIIKNTVDRVTFSADDCSFRIILRQTQAGDTQFFRDEISKYPEWKDALPANIDKFVEETRRNATLCNEKRSVAYPTLSLDVLHKGYIVNLQGHDEKLGLSRLRIMSLGGEHNRFFVLSSTRCALHIGDILEPYDTTLWNIGYPVAFIVYRDGKRIPHGVEKLYQTLPLEHISLIMPSIVQDVIDARNDFSYAEMAAEQAEKFSIAQSPLSLLMHQFSTLMPYYADFDANGKDGTLYANVDGKLKAHSKILVSNDGRRVSTLPDTK